MRAFSAALSIVIGDPLRTSDCDRMFATDFRLPNGTLIPNCKIPCLAPGATVTPPSVRISPTQSADLHFGIRHEQKNFDQNNTRVSMKSKRRVALRSYEHFITCSNPLVYPLL